MEKYNSLLRLEFQVKIDVHNFELILYYVLTLILEFCPRSPPEIFTNLVELRDLAREMLPSWNCGPVYGSQFCVYFVLFCNHIFNFLRCQQIHLW